MKKFEFIIPILIFLVMILGIPLGYKLIMGGPNNEKDNGIIKKLQTVDGIAMQNAEGKKVKIFTNYILIEFTSTTNIYLPSTSIKLLEYNSLD